MYADMRIGTAAPTDEELAKVKHYFVRTLKLDQYYSAAKYEEEAMNLITELFQTHDMLLVTGGSMMYIDALCYGIDDIPTVTDDIRTQVLKEYEEKGLDAMVAQLEQLDPEYCSIVDRHNPKRVLHAIEVCRMSGGTYTALRLGQAKKRPFNIIKVGLTRPREELYERIGLRTDAMMAEGLEEEARRLYPMRGLNSLNTVGYKELFHYFAGDMTPEGAPWTLDYAVDKIKRSTRIYSRKQMTWFKRDADIRWFNPNDIEEIRQYILKQHAAQTV